MVSILITGTNGLLASNVSKVLNATNNFTLFGTDRSKNVLDDLNEFVQGDLLDKTFVDKLVIKLKPDIIINTVALPNLEQCESNNNLAYKINVETAENLALSIKKLGKTKLVHISTDQLFSGEKMFYSESDITSPLNYYGKSKLLAESRILNILLDAVIIRTNFYGWSPKNHLPTFGEWLYDSLSKKKDITLYDDFYFTPIEVSFFAEALIDVLNSNISGIINIAGIQRCSKYEFGKAMANELNLSFRNVTKGKMSEKIGNVTRQKDLSLSVEKFQSLFTYPLPDLLQGLKRFKHNKNN